MASRLLPRRPRTLARTLYAASAVLLAGSLAALGTFLPSRASTPGSDWSANGVMAPTDSAVTVNWNNGGTTPTADQVARDGTQKLPHTDGKTYDDVPAAVRTTVANDFGGLQLTVSQTTGLRHQGVNLTVTGAASGSGQQPDSLLVMQCWGTATETAPDPEDCQDGVGTVDGGSYVQRGFSVADNASGLVTGTDLKAETGVNLYGQLNGDDFDFTAAVTANVFVPSGHQNLATGAKGTVEVLDPNLKVVAKATPVDGIAKLTLPNPPDDLGQYTAEYIATPSENFSSSARSAPAVDLAYQPSSAPGIGANSPSLAATVPFTAVNNTATVPASSIGTYFTSTTTNEVGALTLPSSAQGTSSRTFEMQTGAESPGLGCGKTGEAPSTDTCWLVAIPMDDALPPSYQLGIASPLTPSLWAQRLQVRLGFAPVSTYCSGGSHAFSIGSELLSDAMNSWIPAMCSNNGVDLDYVQTTDTQARTQYASKSTSLIFTSTPISDSGGTSTLYAPAGLSALTISVLSVDGNTRTPVTGIRLSARLVAKLLTESYQNAVDPGNPLPATDTPWYSKMPASLASDPEFQKLNPQLPSNAALAESDLIVTVAGTDATSALWSWIWNDPDAKSFLSGCPDDASVVNGEASTVNPFYSARSYIDCAGDAPASTTLDATTQDEISPKSASNPDGTVLPSSFVYSKPSYPPNAQAFPQPGYYERPAPSSVAAEGASPLTLADLHPREGTMAAVASDVLRGQEKTLSVFCTDGSACPGTVIIPPGVWINGAAPNYGSGVMGVTDGTAAASDLLPTALLCDDAGDTCVGADNDSLQAAAAHFVPSTTDAHFMQAPSTPAWSDGAYPLTIPVYAEIDTAGLGATDASNYAAVLSYLSGTGQQQGYDIGNLPPGMAPLTSALLAQDARAIATLKAIKPGAPASTSSSSAAPSAPSSAIGPGGGTGPTTQPAGTPDVPGSNQVPPVNNPPAAVSPSGGGGQTSRPGPTPSTTPPATATAAVTPAAAIGPLPAVVGSGLAGSLVCGIAAPIVGRRRKAGQ
ncbi:hypothetical protein ACFOYW_15895 [Gryllotalpicola reticulitermitis]|uniref:Uncharacterized protein n=1 Tax=Gryllotalpicola reticulitermitis TaxID=1184153 RepID=A0ABV8QBM5_9MICO